MIHAVMLVIIFVKTMQVLEVGVLHCSMHCECTTRSTYPDQAIDSL